VKSDGRVINYYHNGDKVYTSVHMPLLLQFPLEAACTFDHNSTKVKGMGMWAVGADWEKEPIRGGGYSPNLKRTPVGGQLAKWIDQIVPGLKGLRVVDLRDIQVTGVGGVTAEMVLKLRLEHGIQVLFDEDLVLLGGWDIGFSATSEFGRLYQRDDDPHGVRSHEAMLPGSGVHCFEFILEGGKDCFVGVTPESRLSWLHKQWLHKQTEREMLEEGMGLTRDSDRDSNALKDEIKRMHAFFPKALAEFKQPYHQMAMHHALLSHDVDTVRGHHRAMLEAAAKYYASHGASSETLWGLSALGPTGHGLPHAQNQCMKHHGPWQDLDPTSPDYSFGIDMAEHGLGVAINMTAGTMHFYKGGEEFKQMRIKLPKGQPLYIVVRGVDSVRMQLPGPITTGHRSQISRAIKDWQKKCNSFPSRKGALALSLNAAASMFARPPSKEHWALKAMDLDT
jgi:hypothetical protein